MARHYRRRHGGRKPGKVITLGGRRFRCRLKSVKVKVPGKRAMRRSKAFCRKASRR